MRIKWLGHACFVITSDTGVRILTDPFDEKVGYPVPSVEADIVTTSHGHYDHRNTEAVKGSFIHVKETGTYHEKGITITGFMSYHDREEGAKRGKNIIFKFDIDGINVCHCGDLGHIITPQQVIEIGAVDVLLLPVGGVYTIDYKEATEVIKLLNPKITIPMHFKTEVLSFELDGVEKFIGAAGGKMFGGSEIELDKQKLSQYLGILVLDYT